MVVDTEIARVLLRLGCVYCFSGARSGTTSYFLSRPVRSSVHITCSRPHDLRVHPSRHENAVRLGSVVHTGLVVWALLHLDFPSILSPLVDSLCQYT